MVDFWAIIIINPKMKFKNYSSLFAMVTLIILNTFVNSFQSFFKYLLLKNVIIPKANHLFIGTSLFYLCQLCDFSVAFLEFSFHLNLLSHLCSIINKESVGHFAYLKLSHFLISEFWSGFHILWAFCLKIFSFISGFFFH